MSCWESAQPAFCSEKLSYKNQNKRHLCCVIENQSIGIDQGLFVQCIKWYSAWLIDGNNFIRHIHIQRCTGRQGENRDQFLIRLELHGKSKWLSLYHGAKMIDYHSFFYNIFFKKQKRLLKSWDIYLTRRCASNSFPLYYKKLIQMFFHFKSYIVLNIKL